ncbi:MAG TPA: hypothetical protein VJB92_00510 [Candidatus Paceibacterota bacterium]
MKIDKKLIILALVLTAGGVFSTLLNQSLAVGEPNVTTLPATSIGPNSATLNGNVRQGVQSYTIVWFEYGKTVALGLSVGHKTINWPNAMNADFAFTSTGITENATYYYRAVARNNFGITRGSILSFNTGGGGGNLPPSVFTEPAINIGQNEAMLNSRLNPNGSATRAWFEWGETNSLGNSTARQSLGSGTSFQNISESLINLQPNKIYFFRAVAENPFGISRGSILNFRTEGVSQQAPSAITNPATNIAITSSTLNGSVNPNGSQTSARFEWGASSSLGNSTAVQQVGTGNAFSALSLDLVNLNQNTTYFFRIVAQNSSGTTHGSILSFTTRFNQPGSAPSVSTDSATSISETIATLNGAVNPNNSPASTWFEWGGTPSLGNSTPIQNFGNGSSFINTSWNLTGLNSNTTYYFRVVAQNNFGTARGSIFSFTTRFGQQPGGAPIVNTNSATSISQSSAVLNGNVNPNGSDTTAWFEWGLNPSLGAATGFQSLGSGFGTLNISSVISGLAANATYYFRAVAQNSRGTSYGNILSFTTSGGGQFGFAPSVTTNSATSIGQTFATLNALVNPNNSNTITWFEWGTNFSLGATTGFQSIGSGSFNQGVASTLTNLVQNTTYYFRTVAQNSFGTSYGSILSFTTNGGFQFGGAPQAITFPAESIFETSALLRGTAIPNGASTFVWFEWGDTLALGSRTPLNTLSNTQGQQDISALIQNLTPNTTYYFRAIAENPFGTFRGSILSFRTRTRFVIQPPQPTPPPIIQPPIISQPSLNPSPLKISTYANKNTLAPGDALNYMLMYENVDTNYSLRDLTLEITFGEKAEFVSANLTPVTREANRLTFSLGKLGPSSNGWLSAEFKIKESAEDAEVIVFNTGVDYRDARNRDLSVNSSFFVTVKKITNERFTATLASLVGPLAGLLILILILLLVLYAIYKIIKLFRSRAPSRSRITIPEQEPFAGEI